MRRLDGHRNRWFLDPVLRGGYPADMVDLYEERIGPLEFVQPGDLEEIAAPIDFLGVNFYQPAVVRSERGRRAGRRSRRCRADGPTDGDGLEGRAARADRAARSA